MSHFYHHQLMLNEQGTKLSKSSGASSSSSLEFLTNDLLNKIDQAAERVAQEVKFSSYSIVPRET
jgi:glutamyl/glutaminyl-tRNA synthetase